MAEEQNGEALLSNAMEQIRGEESTPESFNEVEQEAQTEQESQDVNTSENQESTEEEKPGKKYVDIKTANPNDVQARINELYKQTKISDERNDIVMRENQKLTNALEKVIDELDGIKGNQQRDSNQKAVSTIMQQIREADESGDYEAKYKLEEQLLDVKLEQKQASALKDQEKKQREEQKQAAQQQTQAPVWKQDEVAYVNGLKGEVDESGHFKRPWLQPNHPRFSEATLEAAKIADRAAFENKNLSLKDIMGEVDKYMGLDNKPKEEKIQAEQSVLGGSNLTRGQKDTTIQLGNEQRVMYDKLQLKRLGVSEKEYAKRQSLVNRARVSINDF